LIHSPVLIHEKTKREKKRKKKKKKNKDLVVKTWPQALPALVLLENQLLVDITKQRKLPIVKTPSEAQLERRLFENRASDRQSFRKRKKRNIYIYIYIYIMSNDRPMITFFSYVIFFLQHSKY